MTTRPDQVVVPEPEVKARLAAAGVAVPAGVSVSFTDALADPSRLAAAARSAGLREPLVLKGWGGGLIHKSEIGAVRLGVAGYELDFEAAEMAAAAAAAGITLEGFLIEEQVPAGVELLVGVVDRPPFGPVAALGMGGTLAEVLDDVVLRLAPISRADAEAMVAGFKGAELLGGYRGGPPTDTGALIEVLLAVAGPDGVAASMAGESVQLECNPVICTANGVVAADARLISAPGAPPGRPEPPPDTDFSRVFAPRGVAVAGASTRGTGFGSTQLAVYRELGWGPGNLWAVHPTATEMDGVPAVASVADIDGDVDYVVGAVPAAACAEVVRGAAGKAEFVHIISGGFSEAGEAGAELEAELLAAARQSGVRVIGPNCLGTYSPAGRQAFQLNAPTEAGRVAMISQSGGLAGDMVKAGAVRGIRYSKLCTVGNCIDVTPGELAQWLVEDPDTAVLGMYLEDPRDGRRLYEALQQAQGRTPVVMLVGGRTAQGGGAAASHTGALAADHRVWDAVAEATGATLVDTLEELLAAVAYLQRWVDAPVGGGRDTLVLGVGGGASVLGTDAADRAGLVVAPVSEPAQRALRQLGHGVGTSVANPIEIGFGPISEPDVLVNAIDPILADQPYPDVVIHANVQAFFSYGGGGIDRLHAILEATAARAAEAWTGSRLGIVTRNLDCALPESVDRIRRTGRRVDLPVFTAFDEAMVAVAAAKRHARNRQVQTARRMPMTA